MVHLNNNLSFLRNWHRMTYEEFAEKIGCTPAMLKTYTGRGVTPPMEIIVRISDLMGVSIDDLVRVQITQDNYIQLRRRLPSQNNATPVELLEEALKMLKRTEVKGFQKITQWAKPELELH